LAFWLAPIGLLAVQFMHVRSQERSFGMAVCLKFQIGRYDAKEGLVQFGLMWRRNEPRFELSLTPLNQTINRWLEYASGGKNLDFLDGRFKK